MFEWVMAVKTLCVCAYGRCDQGQSVKAKTPELETMIKNS